jgi:hypothetical protein
MSIYVSFSFCHEVIFVCVRFHLDGEIKGEDEGMELSITFGVFFHLQHANELKLGTRSRHTTSS